MATSYDRTEAAARAGIQIEDLDRLVDLGILVPNQDRFSSADIRKASMFQNLVDGGLPIDGLVGELRTGRISLDFLENPAYDLFAALSSTTFRELSQQTGVPVELLLVIREAMGSSAAGEDDRVRENELDVVPLLKAFLDSGYPVEAVERDLRTMGDSIRRMTAAGAISFRHYVIAPVASRPGATGEDIGAAAAAATERMTAADEAAVLALYHGLSTASWTATILEEWEQNIEAAGLYDTVTQPPAMCFLDITGYTRLTEERGDAAAAALATELTRLVQRTSAHHKGRPVKWLGDGVMLFFRAPGAGVMAALDMADGVAAVGLPPAHVGLHAGPVVVQDGDYYGQTVNLASRIAEYARPGEVVVSQSVLEASAGIDASFSEIGMVDLKGVAAPVHLHIARRR